MTKGEGVPESGTRTRPPIPHTLPLPLSTASLSLSKRISLALFLSPETTPGDTAGRNATPAAGQHASSARERGDPHTSQPPISPPNAAHFARPSHHASPRQNRPTPVGNRRPTSIPASSMNWDQIQASKDHKRRRIGSWGFGSRKLGLGFGFSG